MSLVALIVLGLVAGFIAGKVADRSAEGVLLHVGMGVAGAVVGGWLFRAFAMAGISDFALYSLVAAVVGALMTLFAYDAISRKTA
jgi:uncharacterized membrane protein YeaQ/YmgE (transglycosylase-associated protein family)